MTLLEKAITVLENNSLEFLSWQVDYQVENGDLIVIPKTEEATFWLGEGMRFNFLTD